MYIAAKPHIKVQKQAIDISMTHRHIHGVIQSAATQLLINSDVSNIRHRI